MADFTDNWKKCVIALRRVNKKLVTVNQLKLIKGKYEGRKGLLIYSDFSDVVLMSFKFRIQPEVSAPTMPNPKTG